MAEHKVVIFAFHGELSSFSYALSNVLSMQERGVTARLIIEGPAAALITQLVQPFSPHAELYAEVRSRNLISGICKTCAIEQGTLEEAENQNLTLLEDKNGHPSMGQYIEEGYYVVTM